MDRKKFIITCTTCSLGIFLVPALLQGCGGTKYLSAPIIDSDLVVPLSAFETMKNGSVYYHPYIVVQHESLQFPICVYRHAANTFSALWMQCTHQGAELQVFGSRLQCPAHGSEFNNKGMVQNGPADKSLRVFTTSLSEQNLKIKLQ